MQKEVDSGAVARIAGKIGIGAREALVLPDAHGTLGRSRFGMRHARGHQLGHGRPKTGREAGIVGFLLHLEVSF